MVIAVLRLDCDSLLCSWPVSGVQLNFLTVAGAN